ncbi:sodium:calcium antiporter [Streptomyces dysideae]|uniref:Sodium:proton exchanger n=1 Tax=Streptomyces dysideae TaxID=909626 RepID=A0A101UYI6_9ACTN|nr:sodium:proton exchanger [Streptomyces dysideae]KUO19245.1 sodium:proton exchanger [Streptomyces dysideae]
MTSILMFVSGAALLIYSAEKLIGYLIRAASALGVSLFLIAVVFTGIEFDDVFLGVALGVEDLGGVALGTVFGTALSMTGVVLALAAVLTPTRISVPRAYVALLAAAPFVLITFVLAAPLTDVDGVVLLGLFVLCIAYIAVRESRENTPVFRDAEMYEAYSAVRETRGGTRLFREAGTRAETDADHRAHALSDSVLVAEACPRSGWSGLGLALLALAGLVIGATVTGIGTERILQTYGLEGTVFGATIATAVLTMEDIFVTVESVRRGAPEIGIGNVIGSVVFSATGKPGIILLAGGGLVVGPNVLAWHLPAFIAVTGLAACLICTGRLKRWHGLTLLGLYVVYWAVSFIAFGTVPVDAS